MNGAEIEFISYRAAQLEKLIQKTYDLKGDWSARERFLWWNDAKKAWPELSKDTNALIDIIRDLQAARLFIRGIIVGLENKQERFTRTRLAEQLSHALRQHDEGFTGAERAVFRTEEGLINLYRCKWCKRFVKAEDMTWLEMEMASHDGETRSAEQCRWCVTLSNQNPA